MGNARSSQPPLRCRTLLEPIDAACSLRAPSVLRKLLLSSTALMTIAIGTPVIAQTVTGDVTPPLPWLPGQAVMIGSNAVGTVTIAGGTTVDVGTAILADQPTGDGTVTVTGVGSALNISASFLVGNRGVGTLDIVAGGVVTTGGMDIGVTGDANGVATVTGSGSTLDVGNVLLVGGINTNGSASLNVTDGGRVNSGQARIGGGANNTTYGNGLATISGGDAIGNVSTWEITGELSVGSGFYGNGTLQITDGGKVTSDTGIIGDQSFSKGTVIVRGDDGAGTASILDIDSELHVGRSGEGSLTIEAGGRVDTEYARIGSEAGSTGRVVISGADGAGNASILQSQETIQIGRGGDGELTLTDGGIAATDPARITFLGSAGGSTLNFGARSGDTAAVAGELRTGALNFGVGIGTLNFNHTGEIDFSTGMYSVGVGTHTLSHEAGITTLTHANLGFTGATNVTGGTLVVGRGGSGSLAASNVTVGNGATVAGTGALGRLTVQSGGIHAPGNSIGTQTVNGPYILQAGAILEIETNAAGQSDLVIVNGTVDITGATLRVLADAGNYAAATDYLIIDNDGADAVSGTFGTITSNLVFLDPTVNYAGGTGNDVVLTLTRNTTALTSVAQTPNQIAVAGALNQLPLPNPLLTAVFGQSAEGARQAFDALSGEVHATLGSTLARDARFTRGAIFSRLQQAHHGSTGASESDMQSAALGNTGTTSVAGRFDTPMMGLGMGRGERPSAYDAPSVSPLVFWTQAFGSWADADGDGNAASAKRNIGGFLSGVDTHVGGGWRAGLALGYSRSNVSVSQRISSAEIDSTHLAAYAGGAVGSFALRTGASWSWNEIDTERTVVFPGFLDRAEADYDGDTGQIFGEIALPLGAGAFAYEPFAGLAYVHVSTDRFAEQGGAAALSGFGGDESVGFSTLGLRFAWETTLGSMRVVPRASFAWQHAFGDVDPARALSFSGAPGMTIAGTPLARNAALIEAGLDFALSPSATLGIAYNGEIASDIEDHGVSGRLNWQF